MTRCVSNERRAASQGEMNHKNIVILPADGKSNRRLLRPSRGEVARLDMVPTDGMTKTQRRNGDDYSTGAGIFAADISGRAT
jgi:hypothetical protein